MAARPSALLTLPDYPWPLTGGKRFRAWATVRALTAVTDLRVLVINPGQSASDLEGGSPEHPAVTVVPSQRRATLPAAVAGVRRRWPWKVASVSWAAAREAVHDSGRPDLVWYGSLEHLLALPEQVSGREVVDVDDVEHVKWGGFLREVPREDTRLAEQWQRRVESRLWRRCEQRAGDRADRVVVCSDVDADRLSRIGVNRVSVVPNCYPEPEESDLRWSTARGHRVTLAGAFDYEPNADAARFVARDVLPLLHQHDRRWELHLVGRSPECISELDVLPGVTVIGPVDSMTKELAATTVSVVPVRYGGGTRVKILEAFARGVPVVSTPLGCEGLLVEDGRQLLVAKSAAEFAAACERVLAEPDQTFSMLSQARNLYVTRYRPELTAKAIEKVVRDVL